MKARVCSEVLKRLRRLIPRRNHALRGLTPLGHQVLTLSADASRDRDHPILPEHNEQRLGLIPVSISRP